MKAILIAIALTAVPAFAEEKAADDKPLVDKADDKLVTTRQSAKEGGNKALADTDESLAKARKSGKSNAGKAEDGANSAAHKLRHQLGTDKPGELGSDKK